MPERRPKQSVIVISSHVARGSVGNRAAVFALETLSFPVWAIPTVILPWHPGHGSATRIVAGKQEFHSFMQDIAKAGWVDEVGAILTGYMANPDQVKETAKLINKLKTGNPGLIYLCDPVIGDKSGLYVTQDTAAAIRDQLIPLCDVATPNRYELSWLTHRPEPVTPEEAINLGRDLGPASVLVTSSPGKTPTQTGNLYLSAEPVLLASHATLDNPPNGPGDLTAAIFLGHLLSGMEQEENLKRTTASVLEILYQSSVRGSDELTLESDTASILHPHMQIEITRMRPQI